MADQIESREGYTREKADRLGYDWEVVEYFRRNEPGLLEKMWGNSSVFYDRILKNTIPDEKLASATMNESLLNRGDSNIQAAGKAMLRYRAEAGQL